MTKVWSDKSQEIKIPLNLPGLQIASVNFPHNCYSLNITASEDVRRKDIFRASFFSIESYYNFL